MLVDDADPNARSAGSFFVNPTVPVDLATTLAEEFQTIGLSVQYLEGRGRGAVDGQQRIPAAHILRFAGFNPGDSWGPVGLSAKHVLALVTRPGATAADVWHVANHMRNRAEEATGVRLSFEPTFLGTFPPAVTSEFEDRYPYEPGPSVEPAWLTGYR